MDIPAMVVSDHHTKRAVRFILLRRVTNKFMSRIFNGETHSMDDQTDFVALTADVVGAYVSNNSVAPADLPALIQSVHSTLSHAGTEPAAAPVEELKPAVPVKKSLTPDYIVCLDDGKKFKSLKRHLRTQYDMSPEDYRAKWGLPSDYPMVAPAYAAARSALAKKMGLGQQRSAAKKAPAPTPTKRGRRAAS